MIVRIVRITFLLVVALVVLAAALLLTVDLGRFKPQIESFASEALGREFRITGPLHVDLGPTIAVAAEGVRLAGAGPGAEALLSLGKLAIVLDARSLFADTIIVESLDIEGLRLVLEENEDGENNWTFPGGAAESTDASSVGDRLALPALLRAGRLTGTSIHYRSPALEETLVVTSDVAEVRTEDPSGLSLHTSGAVNDTPFRLSANVGDLDGLLALSALRMDAEGALGEIAFDASASVADVQDPGRPALQLRLSGPDVEYLTDLLNMPAVTTGPLELESRIAPEGQDMQVTVSGTFGEFTTLVTGRFVDLRDLENAELRVAASGPDTARVAGWLGIDGAPNDPFNVIGNVSRAGPELSVDGLTVTIGQTRFELSGRLTEFPGPDGAVASLQIDGPDIGQFNQLLGFPGRLEGAFSLDADLEPVAAGGARLALTATTSDITYSIDGVFTDAEDFVGSSASVRYHGPDLGTVGRALGVADLPALAFDGRADLERTVDGVRVDNGVFGVGADRLTLGGLVTIDPQLAGSRFAFEASIPDLPGSLRSYGMETSGLPDAALDVSGNLSILTDGIRLSDVEAQSGPLSATAAGIIVLPAVTEGTEVTFSISGDDFAALLPDSPGLRGLSRPFELTGSGSLGDDQAHLSSLVFEIDQSRVTADVRVALDATAPELKVRVEASSPDLYRLSPDFESVSLPGTAPFEFLASAEIADGMIAIDEFDARVDKGWLRIRGSVEGPPHFEQTDLDVDLRIADMRQLSVLAGRELPEQEVKVRGRLIGNGGTVRLDTFESTLGESDISGTIEYRHGEIPDLSVALASDFLDVTPYLPPLPDNHAAIPASESTEVAARVDERLIPDDPLPFSALSALSMRATIDFEHIRVREQRLRELEVDATSGDGSLTVERFTVRSDGGGALNGRFGIDHGEPAPEVWMRLKGSNIELGLPAETKAEFDALPRYDLNLAFEAIGNTPRELASDIRGYLKLTSGAGRIRTGAMRMFANDFLMELLNTLNPFASSDPYSNLHCTAVLATVEHGQIIGDPLMVLQSDRLTIYADASVDLATERLDADFTTAANKGLGISLSNLVNPYVKVQGTLADPGLAIDPQGALIGGGAAVATGGLSILAKGLRDRFFSSKDPCGVAVADAEEAFAILEEKYAGSGQ